MKTVNAKEVRIPAFGLFINRTITIICGSCSTLFTDKPYISRKMISKCPFCDAINRLPITENWGVMIQIVFNVSATLLFIFLFIIWQKSDWINILLKYTFIIMSIYGLLICLKDFGFIIGY